MEEDLQKITKISLFQKHYMENIQIYTHLCAFSYDGREGSDG
jgi:hypothetical protein